MNAYPHVDDVNQVLYLIFVQLIGILGDVRITPIEPRYVDSREFLADCLDCVSSQHFRN